MLKFLVWLVFWYFFGSWYFHNATKTHATHYVRFSVKGKHYFYLITKNQQNNLPLKKKRREVEKLVMVVVLNGSTNKVGRLP